MRKLIAAGAVASVLLLAGCATSPEQPCTVDDKDRTTQVVEGVASSVYRVYTDCGIFNVEDAFFLGKFNSADTYADIEIGKTYLFETYGFRNGFFSWFPNIVSATEVEGPTTN